MYTVIRQYQTEPGAAQEAIRRAEEGFVPIIRQAPGFVRYAIVDNGGGRLSTVSTFHDRAGADESVRLAASWIKEHLAQLLPNPPQVTSGEVLVRQVNQGTRPRYGVMRRYKADPAKVGEIARLVQSGFLPRISALPGFGSYTALHSGDGTLVSLNAFEDEAAAQESTKAAAGWIREALGPLLPDPPEITTGTIRVLV